MPDTRPGLKFHNGICYACIHYEKQKETDWTKRWRELEITCDKYRGSNGNSYDCAIAVSGGKDSHFQTHIIKDKLKMNPLLLSVGNFDWTETGRKNLPHSSGTPRHRPGGRRLRRRSGRERCGRGTAWNSRRSFYRPGRTFCQPVAYGPALNRRVNRG